MFGLTEVLITIAMPLILGGSADFVRVLDKLPLPLTTYLGGGSDKIIANGERDTCYPGGAIRNRCVLEGGDDICITGNLNSDCVGVFRTGIPSVGRLLESKGAV